MLQGHDTIGAPDLIDPIHADALAHLERLDRSTARAYAAVDETFAHLPPLQAQLVAFAADHHRHCVELASLLRQAGHAFRAPRRDVRGFVVERWLSLVGRLGPEPALRTLASLEAHAQARYDEMALAALPPGAIALVRRMLHDERKHRAFFDAALRERAWVVEISSSSPSPSR